MVELTCVTGDAMCRRKIRGAAPTRPGVDAFRPLLCSQEVRKSLYQPLKVREKLRGGEEGERGGRDSTTPRAFSSSTGLSAWWM